MPGETPLPGGVVQCDEVFLEGILDLLSAVDLRIFWYGNEPYEKTDKEDELLEHICTTVGEEYHPDPDADPVDPDSYLRGALKMLNSVVVEIKRLKMHPELFSDMRVRERFLKKAGIAAKRSKELLHLTYESRAILQRSQARLDAATSSKPVNPKSGRPYQPWESFGRRMPLIKDSPAVTELQQLVPDMRIIGAQQLPRSAVLIIEHWRVRVDTIITEIMRTSPQPEVAERLLPSRDGPISGERIKPGVGALIKRPAAMVPVTDVVDCSDRFQGFYFSPLTTAQTRRNVCFGKQEPVAEMARLMALLDRDVTTQYRRPPAAFIATFLGRDGLREMVDAFATGNVDL